MLTHEAQIELLAMTHRAITDARQTVAGSKIAIESVRRSIEDSVVSIDRSRAMIRDAP
jgi:hypothetical protein